MCVRKSMAKLKKRNIHYVTVFLKWVLYAKCVYTYVRTHTDLHMISLFGVHSFLWHRTNFQPSYSSFSHYRIRCTRKHLGFSVTILWRTIAYIVFVGLKVTNGGINERDADRRWNRQNQVIQLYIIYPHKSISATRTLILIFYILICSKIRLS